MKYKKEEKLNPRKLIRITESEWLILKEEKKKQGISMAKIICNLIKKEYG